MPNPDPHALNSFLSKWCCKLIYSLDTFNIILGHIVSPTELMFLDPCIGVWLLHPDKGPSSFEDCVQVTLGGSRSL